jgi:DNA-binding CsgD family transcriptional regulator/PAS domain-containing protein
MSVDDDLLAVIEALYETAMDETRWPHTLQQLADVTGSQAATFWVLDGSDQPRLPTFLYINFDPPFVREYLDRMAPLDPTVQYLVRHPRAPIVHDAMVISEHDKDRHPYYDWHHRFTDARYRMIGRMSPAPAVQAGVALHRTRNAGRFEPADLERFTLLQRHLERALTVGFRLGSLGTFLQCTTELLDRNPAAVLLLTEQGRIAYANQPACALHAQRDGLVLSDGVALANKLDNEKLKGLIARALSDISRSDAGGAMRAVRPSGKRPYTIFVSPLSRRYPALSALRPAVCVMIIDPESAPGLPLARLRALLGLTESEARLAALLAAGNDLRAAAALLGITYGTARTRLAAIFQKTDTRRQTELVRLLLASLAVA